MAAPPQTFTNAAKATALSNAKSVQSPTSWFLTENWDGFGGTNPSPGERWILTLYAGRIDLQLIGGNWQATYFPGS